MIPALTLDLYVEAGDWGDEAHWHAATETAMQAVLHVLAPACLPGTELSVVLSDDAHIRVLNRDYRGQDKATNVLSFPLIDPPQSPFGPMLGDLIIAHETVVREALDENKRFEHHFAHMIVHGLLHLFGYDHIEDDEAEIMEGLEIAILAHLGLANPYAIPT